LRANGSRECAPDDRRSEAIHFAAQRKSGLRRFARNDGMGGTGLKYDEKKRRPAGAIRQY
jgi:hypothetical protein